MVPAPCRLLATLARSMCRTGCSACGSTWNGNRAGLLYASPTQANIQIPWELAGESQATLTITRNGLSQMVTVPVAAYAPGLFAMNQLGTGQAAAVINTGEIAAPAGTFPGSRAIHLANIWSSSALAWDCSTGWISAMRRFHAAAQPVLYQWRPAAQYHHHTAGNRRRRLSDGTVFGPRSLYGRGLSS